MTQPAPFEELAPRRIGEYEILEEIGRGAMGSIHLAHDALLDREVALKLIATRDLEPEAKALFFREARALARVVHANVVVVHRVGEHEGQPYLVTELVRGGSLDALPKPIPWARAAALGAGVARGLAAAHRRGVLHRDVKPANVMLDERGGVKLVDFGLAKLLETAEPARGRGRSAVDRALPTFLSRSGETAGTPLYMAPEVLLGEAASPQSDVYAAGAVLFELVTGVAPRETLPEGASLDAWASPDPRPIEGCLTAAEVDPRFARVVRRCLANRAAERFATADELSDALEALSGEAVEPDAAGVPPGNPYRGLMAFEIEHHALFFGRDVEARAALKRLDHEAIVVVAGDSGVGKSSLCKAGVAPRWARAAEQRGRVPRVIPLVPGSRPLEALAAALTGVLGEGAGALLRPIDGDDRASVYRRVAEVLAPQEDLLLLVDQLEEVCTLAAPGEAERFGDALLRLCAGPRVRALLTVRADFLTQIAALGELGATLEKSLILLRPMNEEGVRAAVTRPALRRGIDFESDALVDELVRAATSTPGALPLLEFALAELWEHRDDAKGVITAAALARIGSVAGALARHADSVIEGLGARGEPAARRVLLALVGADGTRWRRTSGELGGADPATNEAIDGLVRGRLVVARKVGEESVFELAHETLLREWETLRAWIDATREQAQLAREIEQAADLWARRGRRDDETWSGDALAQAEQRAARLEIDLPPVSKAFLDTGRRRERARIRRRRWLLGGGAGTLSAIALAAIAAAFAFADKEKIAIRQQEQIRLAAADMGQFDLVLETFDWDAEQQRAVPVAPPPSLDFRLHGAAPTDARSPGRPYGDDDLRRAERTTGATSVRVRLEARSGPAFFELTGRGADCGSSWVHVQRLPGYTDRLAHAPEQIRISVPTCQASRAAMVEIPAGPFYRLVQRDAGSKRTDELADLPAFRIDRTEVTRGAFAVYAALEPLTDDAAARTAYLKLDRPGGERLPVVGVNAFTAASYCRFLGNDLPSIDQWLKAMRGGVTLDGAPNPDPRRNVPWLSASSATPANIGAPEGSDLAHAGAFPEDRSPYGVMDLYGNASEWSRDTVEMPELRGLRYVLGASWDTPARYAWWRNMRPDRYLDFTIGIRCVSP